MPNTFVVVVGILCLSYVIAGFNHGRDLPTLIMSAVAGAVGASVVWSMVLRQRNRGGMRTLRGGGKRFSPVWLASPQHLDRVEKLWRSVPSDGKTPIDVPQDCPAVTLPHGVRFPVLFEAVGSLEVVGQKAVFRPSDAFLRTGNFSNIKRDVALELVIPAQVELHTVVSPVSARFSTDWLRLSDLPVEPVMICVGSTGTSAEESRALTQQLREALRGKPAEAAS